MGNLFRRVLAFVLGMIFTIAAPLGVAVTAGFWAYKNIKPVGIVTEQDPALGDINDQSIEDLLLLLQNAMKIILSLLKHC